MDSKAIGLILKAHYGAAKRARDMGSYDSNNRAYWKGRLELCAEIYFDLFNEKIEAYTNESAEEN